MKASEFEEFRTFLLQNEANSGLLSLAQAEFPSIPFDTLIAISSQEKSRQLRSDIPRFTRSHLIRQYISRYIAGDEILNLSNDSGLPPCLLCRFLLENLFGLNKQQITQCLKDPVILNRFQINSNAEENGVVSTARVIEDVQKCVECDQVVSPCVEMVRRVTGLEYVNRFGPGLVIYWFGFIDELNDHSDVLLLDHFPNDNELHCLTRLDVQPQP
ncbi:uncharacterized protein LOC131076795 isoform X3 [Cryptomeria japonica]|uniref:uncharacterized protein LOC131076795 isoform X3 n=1 Tax=Cryptomeria japonica TaxID=3369 RepID=UPI0027DA8147|nr:uncharacterized protein LOC131076795 isoform X3 [Cryptomeria japonica]